MATHGIHGDLLEVTVVSCNKLKDTEWISRQDPYVCIEYGGNKSSTRTCKDGGKNPTFQEKFVYSLIEGLRDLNVTVWNSNTITHDDFIGSGKIPLSKALSQGFDDSSWPLQSKHGRHAGEVRLIMHYSNSNSSSNSNKPGKDYTQKPSKGVVAPSAPPYVSESAPPSSMYSAPPPPSMYSAPPPPSMYSAPPPPSMYSAPPPPAASYPSQGGAYPPPGGAYPPTGGAYPPPSTYPSYPPNSGFYPPAPYPPPATPYPPPAYPSNSAYGSHYPSGSQYPGMFPPPPY